MAKAFVGTSGWQYRHWKEKVYDNAPAKQWLTIASRRFNSVEVDGTFYRLQNADTFRRWTEIVPPDFKFAIRGHRYSTHRKRLLEATETIRRQKEPADALGSHLAIVLWQLPPNFHLNLTRLEDFLKALIQEWPNVRHAFEFRHDSWFTPEVKQVLTDHRVAITISDAGKFPLWLETSTDLVYVRLHGRPITYVSSYAGEGLQIWAERMKTWLQEGRDVYAYFDNDVEACAPFNASELAQAVKRERSE